MKEAYGAFAAVYDQMMYDVDRDAWASYLDGFLKEAGAHDILDCACGTGAMTIRLFQRGYHIVGSDVSDEMLSEARENARIAGANSIVFVQQDMRKLIVHKPIDAILSACDGVNYLTSVKEVRTFFECAAACLKPGGLLLFDVSSPYKFSEVLGANTYTEETEDYTYIWKNNYDPHSRLCEMNLTCFVREGAKYVRFSERHLQRAHATEELLEALHKAGFSRTDVYGAFTKKSPTPKCERIQFAAKKGV